MSTKEDWQSNIEEMTHCQRLFLYIPERHLCHGFFVRFFMTGARFIDQAGLRLPDVELKGMLHHTWWFHDLYYRPTWRGALWTGIIFMVLAWCFRLLDLIFWLTGVILGCSFLGLGHIDGIWNGKEKRAGNSCNMGLPQWQGERSSSTAVLGLRD